MERDAVSSLGQLGKGEAPFQLVFMDPPYRQGLGERALNQLAGSPLIVEDSLVVVEVASDEVLPVQFGTLREFDRRVYGDTAILFFRRTS
jgi:16S rRNA G966 N2-methylase RsmD